MKQRLLFPVEIYTDNIILNIPSLIDFLYKNKRIDKGVKKSNFGGWQSQSNIHKNSLFSPLKNHIQKSIQNTLKLNANVVNMWGNISSKYHYNTIHHHGNFPGFWSGVYYLQTPPNSGGLIIHNPQDVDIRECFFPKRGDLIYFPSSLTHSVDTNLSDEDRISLAFNIEPKLKKEE